MKETVKKNNLVIPINIEICVLNKGKTVMNALTDFSKQPWSDSNRDYNANNAYIGETVLAEAFQNDTYFLEPGVHIFWQLPRVFRNSNILDPKEKDNKQKFLTVPNRWLINKLNAEGTPEKQWVVESDFLSDKESNGDNNIRINPINTPIIPKKNQQPYQFMGRQLTLDKWRKEPTTSSTSYWKDYFNNGLTALGYGEPSFSTFYPNCRSVFGCLEDTPAEDNDSYEVIGWYSDSKDDIINGTQTIKEQNELTQKFKWEIDRNNRKTPFDASLYYGKITYKKGEKITPPIVEDIAIGYSGTEAVSSYLSEKIDGEKKKIENTLQAIMMGSKIKKGSIDSVPNFNEAVHQRGFNGEDGGLIWTLRNTKKKDHSSSPVISDEIAIKLNNLNIAQVQYDKELDRLNTLHFQLYSDWSKYIQACYPPLGEGFNYPNLDDIKDFISVELYNVIQPLQKELGILIVHHNDEKDTYTVSADSKFPNNKYANQVVNAFSEILDELKDITWEINRISSPRFYTPKDPVVLFAGDALNYRYLNETTLPVVKCAIKEGFDIKNFVKENPIAKTESLQQVLSIPNTNHSFESEPAVWQPQLFQWLVELFPIKKYSNEESSTNSFKQDFITSNFQLKENEFDFEKNLGNVSNGFQYDGSSYLSGSVKEKYLKALRSFIIKNNKDFEVDDFESKIEKWLENHQEDKTIPLFIAIEAWLLLNKKFLISQSMGGFHSALLQQRHNIQLPIEDPLGFEQYQQFTSDVAKQLDGYDVMAPMPEEQFIPIRVGGLRLGKLKFTDQFGEESYTDTSHAITSTALTISEDTNIKWLPPRLCQSTRLNLRWLSAKDNTVEVNSHLNTSPVCGWVVANYLNNNLVFYKGDGSQLGYFSIEGNWYPALGSTPQFTKDKITANNPEGINDQLLQVLLYMVEKIETLGSETPNPFLQNYISVLEIAQGNIYPASTAVHDAAALLMSKPMALVRAKIGFEVKGGFRYDQSWNALSSNMKKTYSRTTDDYEKVKLPIRLGEQKQLDDGLVGYWMGDENGIFQENTFYANTTGTDSEGVIHNDLLQKTLDENASNLTLLMDPHGILHATTGLLPVKTIQIPAEHYAQALRKMEVDFLTAPIISSEVDVSISTPKEKDKEWEWIRKNKTAEPNKETITAFNTNGTFTKQKIKEGWLRLKNKTN